MNCTVRGLRRSQIFVENPWIGNYFPLPGKSEFLTPVLAWEGIKGWGKCMINRPGVYASNLLIREGLLNFNEPVYLGDEFKSAPAPDNKPEIERRSQHLSFFPNPARTFFIIEYDLRDFDQGGTIMISDQSGKLITSISINDLQNQMIVSTATFSSGIYLIRLFVNDQLKAVEKVNIQK
jgi:hypothetical protein